MRKADDMSFLGKYRDARMDAEEACEAILGLMKSALR